MTLMNYTEKNIKEQTENSLNKIEEWSRDGSTKKYINQICRDNHIHYIMSLCLLYEGCKTVSNVSHTQVKTT